MKNLVLNLHVFARQKKKDLSTLTKINLNKFQMFLNSLKLSKDSSKILSYLVVYNISIW